MKIYDGFINTKEGRVSVRELLIRGLQFHGMESENARRAVSEREAATVREVLKDNNQTLQELYEMIVRNHDKYSKQDTPQGELAFVGLALAGEAGELANLIKKFLRNDDLHAGERDLENADCLAYALLSANMLKISIEELIDQVHIHFDDHAHEELYRNASIETQMRMKVYRTVGKVLEMAHVTGQGLEGLLADCKGKLESFEKKMNAKTTPSAS